MSSGVHRPTLSAIRRFAKAVGIDVKDVGVTYRNDGSVMIHSTEQPPRDPHDTDNWDTMIDKRKKVS
jgi:hypothetical protein